MTLSRQRKPKTKIKNQQTTNTDDIKPNKDYGETLTYNINSKQSIKFLKTNGIDIDVIDDSNTIR